MTFEEWKELYGARQLLADLDVGPLKPLGYMAFPSNTMEGVKEFTLRKARGQGVILSYDPYVANSTNEAGEKDADYVFLVAYDEQALNLLLEENTDLLRETGWLHGAGPHQFAERVMCETVEESDLLAVQLRILIDKAFGSGLEPEYLDPATPWIEEAKSWRAEMFPHHSILRFQSHEVLLAKFKAEVAREWEGEIRE